MNLLLAFVIFFAIAWLATPQGGLHFTEVQAGSPAEAAGLKAGDTILAIDGQTFDLFPNPDAGRVAIAAPRDKAGQTVTLSVKGADGTVRDGRGHASPSERGGRPGSPGDPRRSARVHGRLSRARRRVGDRSWRRLDRGGVHA